MLWRCPGLGGVLVPSLAGQKFEQKESALAADWTEGRVDSGETLQAVLSRLLGVADRFLWTRDLEENPAAFEVLAALRLGEQAVVTEPDEVIRQDVQVVAGGIRLRRGRTRCWPPFR